MTAQQTFSPGIFGGTERDCLLVVGQTKDDETQIFYKVLQFQFQHTLVNFHDVKQLVPLNPSRIQMTDILQTTLRDGLQDVTTRIKKSMAQAR